MWVTYFDSLVHLFTLTLQEKRLKERFDTIPSPDDLYSLGIEGFKAEIILVDIERDKKISALKQLCTALVKGLNSNPAAMIKKVAGLVSSLWDSLHNVGWLWQFFFLQSASSFVSLIALKWFAYNFPFWNCSLLLPLFQIVSHSNFFGESNYFYVWPKL